MVEDDFSAKDKLIEEKNTGMNLLEAKYGSQNRGQNYMKAKSGTGILELWYILSKSCIRRRFCWMEFS